MQAFITSNRIQATRFDRPSPTVRQIVVHTPVGAVACSSEMEAEQLAMSFVGFDGIELPETVASECTDRMADQYREETSDAFDGVMSV